MITTPTNQRVAALLVEHPVLARLDEFPDNSFLSDLYLRLHRGLGLTERQVEAALRTIDREDQKAANRETFEAKDEALRQQGVKAPHDVTREVEGVVTSARWKDTAYGSIRKLLIVHDDGWKLYVSQPKSLAGGVEFTPSGPVEVDEVQVGDRIRLTCHITRSERDVLFAFGKRPTKASIVARRPKED